MSTALVLPNNGLFGSEWFSLGEPVKYEKYISDAESDEYCFYLIDGMFVDKKEFPSYASFIVEQLKKREQTAHAHIVNLVELAKFPAKWINEKDVEPPNYVAKQNAIDVAEYISEEHGLLPIRIGASIESGLMLTYYTNDPQYVIKIEVYNDSDVAGVISLNKEIIDAIDINDNKDIDRLLDKIVPKENKSPKTFTAQW